MGNVVEINKPVNLVASDTYLFEAEFVAGYDDPELITISNVLFNFYSFQSFNKHVVFNKYHKKFDFQPFISFFKKRLQLFNKQTIVLDHWSSNYFHWFTEVIPAIILLAEQKKINKLLVPLWVKNINFIEESLKRIPGLQCEYVSNKYNTYIFKATFVNLNVETGRYNPEIIQKIHNLFTTGSFTDLKRERNGAVFIFRSLEQKRGIINFDEAKQVLDKYGVQVVDFGNLSWGQQVDVCQTSKILIGVHGAGLTNMLFMEKDSIIFELRKEGDATNNCYFSLASMLGHKYYYQTCKVDNEKELTQKNNFYLDLKSFEENLRKITDSFR